MENVLTRKLERLSPLVSEDKMYLSYALDQSRRFDAGVDIINHSDAAEDVCLIAAGLACQIRRAEAGQHQILRYLLPGDFCNLQSLISSRNDITVRALTSCEVFPIPRKTISQWIRRPNIAQALWFATLADESVAHEALVNVGFRRAEQMIAHFLCEMFFRLDAAGLVIDNSFDLPITQIDLGCTLGLSTVHINRALQNLRNRKLIALRRKIFTILDIHSLKALCEFDPGYLYLSGHPA